MGIKSLELVNFRSYGERKLRFEEPLIIVSGPNGVGKTNIMESIYLLAQGKSFRADLEEEMISYSQEVGRVRAVVEVNEEMKDLEVVLTRGEVAGEKVGRKKFLLNGVPKRVIDFVGVFRAVLFGPWDLDLITDSPSLRRRFLDSVLVQVDREYRRALMSYEKGLRQRNHLLERVREEGISRSQLLFWDKLLIKNGGYITQKREEFLSFMNLYQPFTGTGINYVSSYERSAISESRLAQYAQEEVAAAATLVGPHRDDVTFSVGGDSRARDLSKFGSRGEQRLAVLWLKMAELEYLSSVGERPTLLLDDIFSELDHEHRGLVSSIVGKQQTFITTADEHYIDDIKEPAQVISLP